jgi:probable F420-dependent oxidoreductase
MTRQVTFGVALYTGQRPPGREGPMYADAVALARAAEAAGFDVFWVSEHHGWEDGYLPAPLTLAAALAVATTRIRIGTGLAIAPFYHPVRLAEEAAVVDHLAGGRLILGLGAGYLPWEFRALGSEWRQRGRRLEETVAVLRAAWSGRPFTHRGRVFELEGSSATPPPIQQPIPIWLGGYAPAAVDRAGEIADGHLVGRAVPDVVAAASEQLARRRDPADPAFTFAANVSAVLDEPDGAPASARAGYTRQQAAYEAVQREHDAYSGRIAGRLGEGATGLALGEIDAYLQARGTVADLADQAARCLEPAAAWASLHVALRIIFPEDDLDAQRGRIAAFGSRVLPVLRAKLISAPLQSPNNRR